MPYKLSSSPNHTVQLNGHLDAETVARERETVLHAIRRHASVPGFRPGKAPVALVKARFATQVKEELEQRLTGMLWQEVLDGEADLRPIADPVVSTLSIDEQDVFRLSAELEVLPRLELAALESLTLPEHPVEVAEAEIDAELTKLCREQAPWEPAEDTPAADGLMVEADVHSEVVVGEGKPASQEGAQFVLGAEGVPAEITEALRGARVGEERVAETAFASEGEEGGRPARTVRYRMTVKNVRRQVIPEADDSLAKTVGLDSLAALRDRVKEVLLRQKKAARFEAHRRSLLDQLEAGFDLSNLPPSLVRAEVESDLHRFAYTMAMHGVDPGSKEMKWQELAARFEPQSRRRVLDRLVLDQVADKLGLEVPDAVVDAFIEAEAKQVGVAPAEHRAALVKEDRMTAVARAARFSVTETELIRRAGGEVD